MDIKDIKLLYRLNGSFRFINAINENCKLNTYNKPFKYFIIDDFLKPEVHQEIKDEFQSIPIDWDNKHKGSHSIGKPLFVEYTGDWHDAHRMNLNPEYGLKMNFFISKEYYNFITSFYPEIEFTNEVLTELHHHEKFSRRGFVHNDYDPAAFLGDRIYAGLDTSWRGIGKYACDNPEKGRFVVRSASCLYYIGYGDKVDKNKPAGGHTAFFRDYDIDNPIECVEPIENRLLIFPNNPISFHASRTNNSTYRDTIYSWFHSEMNFMKKMYPDTDICESQR